MFAEPLKLSKEVTNYAVVLDTIDRWRRNGTGNLSCS